MDGARAEAGPGTRLVGVIGSPIAHSLSPLLHNAAFAALGLEGTWRSLAFEVAPGQAADALDAMRRADISGLSVTMPHKADVAALVDECTDVARRLEAVNCVVNRDGVLLGTNTDGEGFVASLARGAAFTPPGRRCLVIGAGGAARAVVLALAEAGASEVAVLNRTPERAATAAALAGRVGSVVRAAGRDLAEAVGPPTWWSTPHRSAWRAPRTAARRRLAGGAAAARTPARSPPTWSTPPGRRRGWSRRPRRAPRRSTASACWCTRRRRSWSCGPGGGPGRGHVAGGGGGRSPRDLRPAQAAGVGGGGRFDFGRPERGLSPAPPASPRGAPRSARRAVTGR